VADADLGALLAERKKVEDARQRLAESESDFLVRCE
jgi:hypothetical protein